MNTYIFWTAVGDEAESAQVAFSWHGVLEEGERRLAQLGRRITSSYILTTGKQPAFCSNLNLLTHPK